MIIIPITIAVCCLLYRFAEWYNATAKLARDKAEAERLADQARIIAARRAYDAAAQQSLTPVRTGSLAQSIRIHGQPGLSADQAVVVGGGVGSGGPYTLIQNMGYGGAVDMGKVNMNPPTLPKPPVQPDNTGGRVLFGPGVQAMGRIPPPPPVPPRPPSALKLANGLTLPCTPNELLQLAEAFRASGLTVQEACAALEDWPNGKPHMGTSPLAALLTQAEVHELQQQWMHRFFYHGSGELSPIERRLLSGDLRTPASGQAALTAAEQAALNRTLNSPANTGATTRLDASPDRYDPFCATCGRASDSPDSAFCAYCGSPLP